MDQLTFATATFEAYRKPTRREKFPAQIDQAVPWADISAVIEPFYPKAGNGRPPIELERVLRIYFLQHGFNPMFVTSALANIFMARSRLLQA